MSEDNITIPIDDTDFSADSLDCTVDLTKYSPTILGGSSIWNTSGNSNITVGYAAGSNFYGTPNYTFTKSSISAPGSMQVKGDAEFEGDVKIKGVSIAKTLDDIQKRLAILVPDPAKLEHFEALKRAYKNYKILENLCQLPVSDPDK